MIMMMTMTMTSDDADNADYDNKEKDVEPDIVSPARYKSIESCLGWTWRFPLLNDRHNHFDYGSSHQHDFHFVRLYQHYDYKGYNDQSNHHHDEIVSKCNNDWNMILSR